SPSGSVILSNASVRYRAQLWDLNRARPFCMQWRAFLKWLPGRGFTSAQETNSRPRFLLCRAAPGSFALRFALGLACLGASLLGRRPDHGFQFHAIRIGEINGIVLAAVILARRIDDIDVVALEKSAKGVDILAACHFEGVVMKADIAFAVFAFPAFGVGGGDPEQGLTVAPSGHVAIFVLELEAEKREELVVERLRAREVADAQNEMVNAGDLGHEVSSG